jgi:hypothetical protein
MGIVIIVCASLGSCRQSQQSFADVSPPTESAATARNVQKPPAELESAIRSVDLAAFVKAHVGEINPDLADLQTECGEDQPPVTSIAPAEFGDVDGDGEEEAAMVGFSCLSGTGGADFAGVLKLLPSGKLVVLPMEPLPKVFRGRDVLKDLRGHQSLRIENGRLLHVFPIYAGGEPNCCPEGGERHFIYRWDGHKFVVDDIMEVPPEKSGS